MPPVKTNQHKRKKLINLTNDMELAQQRMAALIPSSPVPPDALMDKNRFRTIARAARRNAWRRRVQDAHGTEELEGEPASNGEAQPLNCTEEAGTSARHRSLFVKAFAASALAYDAAVFRHMSNLKVIDLSGMKKLEGSLNVFVNNHELEILNLRDCCKLRGDLSVVQQLRVLRSLSLRGCSRITGDIGVFRDDTTIRNIALTGTNCHGSVEIFSRVPALEQLHLSGHKIDGHLAHMGDQSTLVVLALSNTLVQGELRDLAHLQAIKVLKLHFNPNLFGNFKDLSWTFSLRQLDIKSYRGQFVVPGFDITGWLLGMRSPLASTLPWCNCKFRTETRMRFHCVPYCFAPRGRRIYKCNRQVMRVAPLPPGVTIVISKNTE